MSTNDKTTGENDQLRFSQGVLFRGKLFGVEDVKKETGDDVCNDSMIKLRAVLAAKKESKKPICIKINLEGIELIDEKDSTQLYKHSVNKISYIARDVKDARAIGYIYKNSENNFQYFGLRTIDQAQTVFNTLKDLFEVVLKMRKEKKTDATENTTPTSPTPPIPPPPTTTTQTEVKIAEPEKEPLIDSTTDLITKEEDEKQKNLIDIFNLFGSSNGSDSTAQSGLNPLASFNDGIFSTLPPSTSTTQPNIMMTQRSSPAMPNPPMNNFGMNPTMMNPMMMNPMSNGFILQQQQQQQFQGIPNNQMINNFGNPFQATRQMAPMNMPMNTPAVQINQFQTANKQQQQQQQQVNKPFQWP
jgi:hypothetical protein